ncbi:hypothetical protein F442_01125, partial [Phytophthora nicotianae P10297]
RSVPIGTFGSYVSKSRFGRIMQNLHFSETPTHRPIQSEHGRLAVYCGKAQHESELGGNSPTKIFADPNSDPSAVVRNLDEVLPPPEPDLDFTVVTNRFYTSHCHHSVEHGKEVATPHATYFSDVPRGSTKVAVLKSIPHMTAPLWWDR